MSLLGFRAFSTEFIKISQALGDAEIRALLAERNGEEYLKGGELPTNTLVPQDKLAQIAEGLVNNPSANIPVPAPVKKDKSYQSIRDAGAKTLGGAAAGAGAMKLVKELTGKALGPGHFRAGAALGAGVAIADQALNHRHNLHSKIDAPKIAFVQQNPNASFRSPADELSTTSNVGKFQVGRVHQSVTKPLKIPMPAGVKI